jgi:hypothetical protein
MQIRLSLPHGTVAKQLEVKCTGGNLRVCLKGGGNIFEGHASDSTEEADRIFSAQGAQLFATVYAGWWTAHLFHYAD